MVAASREVDLYGTHSRIPSLEHLLALKLHSLKNTRLHRFLRDFLDVENLLRINKLDIKSETFASYSSSMAQWNCMKKHRDHSRASDVLNETAAILEFPVAPDFIAHAPKIDP
jgi:hypothetical protein